MGHPAAHSGRDADAGIFCCYRAFSRWDFAGAGDGEIDGAGYDREESRVRSQRIFSCAVWSLEFVAERPFLRMVDESFEGASREVHSKRRDSFGPSIRKGLGCLEKV